MSAHYKDILMFHVAITKKKDEINRRWQNWEWRKRFRRRIWGTFRAKSNLPSRAGEDAAKRPFKITWWNFLVFDCFSNTEKIRWTNFSSDCSVCYVLKQFISSSNEKEVVSLVPGSRFSQLFPGKTNCFVWFPEVCRFCLTLRVWVMDGGQLEPPEE